MFLKPFRGARLNRTHPLARGLVAAYLMNEGGGNQIFDIAGNNTGAFVNASEWVPGQNGPAVEFNGIDDQINVSQKAGFSGTTGSLIYRTKSATNNDNLMSYRLGLSNQFRIDTTGGSQRFNTFDGATAQKRIVIGSIDINTWMDSGITWDNGAFKTYKNGLDSGNIPDGAGTGIWNFQLADNLIIGKGQNFFEGLIDFIYLFNRALSASEVFQLYRESYAFIERSQSKGALFVEEIVAAGIVPILDHHYRMMRN